MRGQARRGKILAGTIDTFLLWRLTGGRVHATDVSNASRTMLFNIRRQQWDDELLKLLRVPRAILPEVRDSSGEFGVTEKKWFGAEIPICGVVGDQQAATFGQCCFRAGMAKNTYGTVCFLMLNTGPKPVNSKRKLLTTIGWRVDGKTTYCLEGSVFVGGAAVGWLRDGLQIIRRADEVEKLARTVDDNGGTYFVPALVGLGAPHWDPYARGLIIGLDRSTKRGHIARAAVESMAFQSRDLIEAMERDTGAKLRQLRVDGGAASNNDLLQFQADLLGMRIQRSAVAETTALGARVLGRSGGGNVAESSKNRGDAKRRSRVLPQYERPDGESKSRTNGNVHWSARETGLNPSCTPRVARFAASFLGGATSSHRTPTAPRQRARLPRLRRSGVP